MTAHVDPTGQHAVYAPSSAHRWIPCTASAAAIAQLPEQEEGEEAQEGTAAHDEIERVLGPFGGDGMGLWVENSKYLTVNPEHPAAYGVALVVDYVRQLPPGCLWIEQRVTLTPEIWGRCDVAHWDDATATLTIVDYKNGMRMVDADDNPQLRIYAAASIFTHNLPAKWIRYVVVQPNDWRPFVPRVKQHTEAAATLYAWASETAKIPRSPLKFTAGDHCRDCPLFGRCDASLDMLQNIGAVISGLMTADQVPAGQRALFLACKKPIEDAFKNAEKIWTQEALKTETPPPGMKLVIGTTKRAWKDEKAARAAILEKFGPEKLNPPTPAQAEDMGLDVSELAGRPEGVPVLAFASDKRKTWQRKSAAEMFAGVTTGATADAN
jgi:hypothetical protein